MTVGTARGGSTRPPATAIEITPPSASSSTALLRSSLPGSSSVSNSTASTLPLALTE